MKTLIKTTLLSLTLAASAASYAGTAVIVSANSNVDAADQKTIGKIFLGKSKKFANGTKAVPVNQSEGSAIREDFSKSVIKRSSNQVKSYWAQLVFTGKGTPPTELADDAAVKAKVAADPNAVGYIDEANVDGTVKVIYKY